MKDSEDYSRKVQLFCPTCGSTELEDSEETEGWDTLYQCISCENQFSRQNIIEANHENIQKHVEEVKGEIIGDFQKMFKKIFDKNKR